MDDKCPVCGLALKTPIRTTNIGENRHVECLRCGKFTFTRTAGRKLEGLEVEGDGWKTKLSHWIRSQQGDYPQINYNLLISIIEKLKMPTVDEQAENLIIWLAKQLKNPSDAISCDPVVLAAVVGCEDGRGVDYIAKYLSQEGLVDYNAENELGRPIPYWVTIGLSVKGWKKYREIKRGNTSNQVHAATIFLSYASEDKEEVEKLHIRLESEGFSPWMDTKNLIPGEDWNLALEKAIKTSTFFVACMSRNSITKRGMIQKELREAMNVWKQKLPDDIYLIPVRLEECEIPDSLKQFQWVNLYSHDGFEKLIKAINTGLERLRS